jgi:hypothetical protein
VSISDAMLSPPLLTMIMRGIDTSGLLIPLMIMESGSGAGRRGERS